MGYGCGSRSCERLARILLESAVACGETIREMMEIYGARGVESREEDPLCWGVDGV